MAFPFFNQNMGGKINPFQNMQNMIRQINAIRQNPNELGQFLYQQGKITKQQLDELQSQGISGNPEAIGNYLMNHGMMNQQQAQDVYQNFALPIQNSMKQN